MREGIIKMRISTKGNKSSTQKPRFKEVLETWGLLVAAAVLFLMLMLPTPAGLNEQGYRVIMVLIFMIIIWITESVSYHVSSIYLIASMTLLLGFSTDNGKLIGTTKALAMSLSGFSSSAWILAAAALFISAAIENTGLGRRIGYSILSLVGAKAQNVIFGFILMSFILSLFIPAQVANAALMTAIAVGVIQAFGIDRKGNLAKGLLLSVAFSIGFSGMGILTAGIAPVQAVKFIEDAAGVKISWLQWSMYGLPFAVALAAVLFFLILRLFPPEIKEIAGGKEKIKEQLKQLGAVTAQEKKLLVIMLITICLWATGDKLHKIDSSAVAVLTLAVIFYPHFKITNWRELNDKVSWGTLMLFGAANSLGTYMLNTGAAAWIANKSMISMGVANWPKLGIAAAGIFFFAIFALAFSSRSAAVAALIPTAIGFAQGLGGHIPVWGLALLLYYPIQFSVLLPVNTPISMIAYSSDTFSSSDMFKLAVPLVISAIILALIFAVTYWKWLGMF
jgi:solute carrier family 13 (sodium-dependent dicarboxylate transporter), member 2/3/5